MQNLEDENNKSAVEAAGGKGETVAPGPATASPSVSPTAAANPSDARESESLTPTSAVSNDPANPLETAKVHGVPAEHASSRLDVAPGAPAAANAESSEHATRKPEGVHSYLKHLEPHVTAPAAPAPSEPPAAPAEEKQYITIDDFAKVELRVAQVLVAERIPKADKLLRLEVDLGYEKRQILAGIAQYYEPEKLIGRKIVIVANLAPRKMRGLESNGMLLAASLPPDGAPVLAGFLEDVPLGARLK
jgi:methionyl-tRNA synthetase